MVTVGIDLSKNVFAVFAVHAVNGAGKPVLAASRAFNRMYWVSGYSPTTP
jgi:hypothetical protein